MTSLRTFQRNMQRLTFSPIALILMDTSRVSLLPHWNFHGLVFEIIESSNNARR